MHPIELLRLPADAVWWMKFRRTRRHALARFFDAPPASTKRVAVVGNGPSVNRADRAAVAQCERVIRFNYFPPDDMPCTDWVVAMTTELAERLLREGVAPRLAGLDTLWLFRPHSEKVAAKADALFGPLPRRELPRESREQAKRLLGGYPPTAGMIALFALPALFPDYERRIAGIGDGGGGRHYFNKCHRPWWRHNLRRERWIVRYLVREGALRAL